MKESVLTIRYNWIDWVKAVGIWLVILGHGNLVNTEIRQLIYSFHMPLFFVLSGYLFKTLPIKLRLRKDFYTLIIPYFGLNGICFLIWFIGGYLIKSEYNGSLVPLIQRLGAIFLGLGYNTGFWIPVSTPTWFLITLFLVRCIVNFCKAKTVVYSLKNNVFVNNKSRACYSVFWKRVLLKNSFFFIYQNKRPFLLVVLSIALGYILTYFDVHFYFAFNSVIMALPFFIVGIWMKKRLLTKPWIWGSVCLGITLCIAYYNGRVDMATFNYGRNIFLFYVGGFSGTFFIFAIAQLLNSYSNRFIRVISEGTVLIIGFNLLVLELVMKFLRMINFLPETSPLIGIVISFFILFLFYPGILFFGKYFPSLIGKRTNFVYDSFNH